MEIRPEASADHIAIGDLTTAAFAPMPFSSGTEAAIIEGLRLDGDLTLSLVAEDETGIIGHIAFSPVSVSNQDGGWYGLGPISVRAERQRQGIGRALTETGLEGLKALGARGCALIGNPALYSRLGFVSDGRLAYRTLDPRYVQWILLSGASPEGTLAFAPAFGKADPK